MMRVNQVKCKGGRPVLDFHTAKDNSIACSPRRGLVSAVSIGGDNKNLVTQADVTLIGDVEGIMADCDITIDHTYHMKAYNQAMMEPFICYTNLDRYGGASHYHQRRLYSIRRILSMRSSIPKSYSCGEAS